MSLPLDLSLQLFEGLDIDTEYLPQTTDTIEQLKQIRKVLISRIEELAEKDMERLMGALYRIDVSERKLKETLVNHPPENFAPVIADLIIERQLEKAESRKKFSGGEEGDW
jgi:hypothetical protein